MKLNGAGFATWRSVFFHLAIRKAAELLPKSYVDAKVLHRLEGRLDKCLK